MWGVIAFIILYCGLSGVIAALLSWLVMHIPEETDPQYRLGSSVWLCTGCHRLYDHQVTRCPQGHTVIEATQVMAAAPEVTDSYYSYATEAALEVFVAEN